jgi:hypothetical protein
MVLLGAVVALDTAFWDQPHIEPKQRYVHSRYRVQAADPQIACCPYQRMSAPDLSTSLSILYPNPSLTTPFRNGYEASPTTFAQSTSHCTLHSADIPR